MVRPHRLGILLAACVGHRLIRERLFPVRRSEGDMTLGMVVLEIISTDY